jgi:hypothetical protein
MMSALKAGNYRDFLNQCTGEELEHIASQNTGQSAACFKGSVLL